VIFAARGFLVSLAFFAMVYCPLASLVVLAWWSMNRASRKSRFSSALVSSANFLFGLRIFSFAVSAEDAGTFVLAVCSLVILSAGLFRVLRAQAKTSSAVTQWSLGLRSTEAMSIGDEAVTPALSASKGAPALLLVGIRRPKVMVSDMAAVVLSGDELQAAVRHEFGHMRSWDNLKKVLIGATPFPGMRGLESAWREAAELAADDAAVANRQDALNLAAALIKLSRSSKQWSEPALASGLVSGSCSIRLRVGRLLEWRAADRRLQRAWPWTLLVLIPMIAGMVSNYGAMLVLTHRLTELLVP
jgi:Zn-dependent protease with chaperone function